MIISVLYFFNFTFQSFQRSISEPSHGTCSHEEVEFSSLRTYNKLIQKVSKLKISYHKLPSQPEAQEEVDKDKQ